MATTSRIKIDLTSGTIEAEGDESFVREMVERYWASAARPATSRAGNGSQAADSKKSKTARAKRATGDSTAVKTVKKTKATGIVEDVEFRAQVKTRINELDSYIKARSVKSQIDEVVTIGSFLAVEMEQGYVTHSQYYTALRLLGRKLPKNPRQVLIDAKNKRGFFYESDDKYSLTPAGINHAEQVLPATEQ